MAFTLPLPVLGSYFVYTDRSIRTDVGTGISQILPQNPNRWAAIFWFVSGTLCTVSPFSNLGAAGGIPLMLTPNFLKLSFPEVGGMIQGCWFAQTSPTAQQVGCVDVEYRPPASAGYNESGEP